MPNARTTPLDANAVRRRNLSSVLDLVHRRRGVTRADLTRALGLNRSTIGDLVGVLVAHGWVDERDDARRSGVGRPSPLVVTRSRWLVAAINPELDVIDIALVSLGGEIVERRRTPADRPSADEVVAVAARVVAELAAAHPDARVLAVGVAVPGLVRRGDGCVRLAPRLGWRDEPLASALSSALGMPVAVANDAHLGSRAELTFGAGQGAASVLYLNGGASGIGGGLVIGGRPVEGAAGYAGEIGHVSVDPHGIACACGAHGCLEALVRRGTLTAAVGLTQADDDELDAALQRAVAAEAADGPVRTVVREQLGWLAIALRSAVNLLNPERIVLGGYLAALWAAAGDDLRQSVLADALSVTATDVRIEVAALGAQRLLMGAAELAWDGIIADPTDVPLDSTVSTTAS
ncbi:ROK family transcriptional regulator [Microcella humidisoli]|uniref:ROK family protein n=1 Tax=Microcella humidisoli TaxID=2963406 RepID=A0ABY5FZS8_9MICO|nr:ROK family transcriptional regulator [Microcella humidisoli]UTT63634.1 ROK family protein [Microcella humidisoli]